MDDKRTPDRIWAVESLGLVGTGRWVTQEVENPHGNVPYLLATPAREAADDLLDALEAWLELSEHCSIEEGVCCCGDNMENHSNPMDCGHSPVDHGDYVATQLIERTRTLIAKAEGQS